jgi:hypothetical protein
MLRKAPGVRWTHRVAPLSDSGIDFAQAAAYRSRVLFRSGPSRMLCRHLRNLLVGHWILAGLVCLTLVGGSAVCFPIAPEQGDAASVTLRAPAIPLAVLEIASLVRLEKQAHSNRVTFPKPERSGQPSWAERHFAIRPTLQPSRTSHTLPRRFLPAHHFTPRDPSDSGEPFLAALSLS